MSGGWNTARGILLLVLGATVGQAEFPVPQAPFEPRMYDCPWTGAAPRVDGRLDEACWETAPWTEDFLDIRGGAWPAPLWRTRAKLLWDADYLYVGAWLEEPELWATFTRHDAVIYHENDFELFLDPDGDNHHYVELEINALGTVWDLLLTRPYRDEGCFALDAWEIPGLRSAVSLDGTLNQPGDVDRGWSVELALPWEVLEESAGCRVPPLPGDAWRLNFSRVQWHREVADGRYVKRRDPATGEPLPEENWVWSPQGLVAMHYPERWGLLRFSADSSRAAGRETAGLPADVRAAEALMQVYYAQRDLLEEGACSSSPRGAGEIPVPGWTPVAVRTDGRRFTACTSGAGLELCVDETGRLGRRKLETRP